MLTRDLLRYQRRNGFRPAFIKPDDTALLSSAGELLSIYREAAASMMRRGEIAELTEVVLKGMRDTKLANGLDKLIQDRCTFAPVQEIDYVAERRRLFLHASSALPEAAGDLERYRASLAALPGVPEFMAGDIYGDLPDNERLTGFRELYPLELLHRYNLALVQGLLVYAETLELDVCDENPAALRRLFKYLKFFRLLAELKRPPGCKDRGRVQLVISGPFSLFANTRKYALQLAEFFPAVVGVQKWSLQAKLNVGALTGMLKLDESSQLVSHYRTFSTYVPEEIRMFHDLFRREVTDWKIVGESPFIEGVRPELIFPDLSFRHEADQRLVHLELFHRWHRGQLEQRLNFLAAHLKTPLIIGIDRSLLTEEEYAALQERYPQLVSRLFRFRDFPGVDRARRTLQRFLEG